MENLIGNAWKYSSRQSQAVIEFGATMDKSTATYYVRDNGVGFDMAFAGKLFGVFERLHAVDEFEGTGIGLATVHRVIRRHRGEIWAESSVGNGATFYFTIGLIGTRGGTHEQQQSDSAGRGQSGRRTTDPART
jgi:light-regulated signal transduction histidine kinase (bacteriophytochrome)